jgi:glucosamine-6-phosphate deaminase
MNKPGQGTIWEVRVDGLAARAFEDRATMGRAAAAAAAAVLRDTLTARGEARVVFASAPSQNEFLDALVATSGIAWDRVTAFHLDEYVGLPGDHPQSFCTYIRQRLFTKVKPGEVHFMNGAASDPAAECRRYAALLVGGLDLACIGIGENGHLAFNDPPVADFNDPILVKTVTLEQACREQQVHDGCFARLEEVPTEALTLTLPAILGAREIVCVVPGPTKTEAVTATLRGPIGTACPASGLRRHPDAALFLDAASAAGVLPER